MHPVGGPQTGPCLWDLSFAGSHGDAVEVLQGAMSGGVPIRSNLFWGRAFNVLHVSDSIFDQGYWTRYSLPCLVRCAAGLERLDPGIG